MVDSTGRRWPVRTTITVTPAALHPDLGCDPSASVWKLQLHNGTGDMAIVEVLFPLLRGLLWSPPAGEDRLVYPHHAGEKCSRPADTYRSERYQRFSRAETVREASGRYAREITYCGLASMMWMDYFDDAGGLYLASADPEFLLTGLRVEVHVPAEAVPLRYDEPPATLGLGLRKFRPVAPGESWTTPPALVAFHDGDWHWGARQYRAWFDRAGMPDLERLGGSPRPQDLDREAAMLPFYELRRETGVLHRFDELPAIYDRISARYHARHFFIAGWNRSGFDSQYPEYHPDMDLGSPMDLKRVVDHVAARGGFTTFYINSRLFDRSSFFHPTLGREWAIQDADGSTHQEKYGPVEFDVCCPAHRGWQKHLLDFAEWMVRAYGARGIYYDQLGSATPWACYHPGHTHQARGHPDTVHNGLYNQGYVALIEEASRRLRAIRPDSFLMIENCGDLYSTRVWGSLVWNGTLYDEFFNLFKYTFPEVVLIQMIQTRSGAPIEEQEALFRRDLDSAWLLGSVFWLHAPRLEAPPGLTPRQVTRTLQQVDAILPLRQTIAPVLARTRFVDTEGLWLAAKVDEPHRFASHWVGKDEHLVLLVPRGAGRNGNGQPAVDSVEVQLQPHGSSAHTGDASGEHGTGRARSWRVHRYVARVGGALEHYELSLRATPHGRLCLDLWAPKGSGGPSVTPGDWEAWHMEGQRS
ncbi:MAG: hypothetical protein IMX02_10330 [Limnochordaceae bacterium]|nr:hypothetical protein [Limnochordaceae bacterium]